MLFSFKWFKSSIFRQLNIGISLMLCLIFLALGFITYYNYYRVIQTRESELLHYRIQKVHDDLNQTLQQFKREIISLYNTKPDNLTQGINRYFLPSNIPKPDEMEEQYIQSSNIRNYLTTILNRNPLALDVSFYRIGDSRFFHIGKLSIPSSFEINRFFLNQPRTFTFPFIGASSFGNRTNHSYVYVLSPIFNMNAIKDTDVFGYFMMVFDPAVFYESFMNGNKQSGQLLIEHNQNILFNSNSKSLNSQENSISERSSLKEFHVSVVGIKNKSDVRSTLNKIEFSILAILLAAWLICIVFIAFIQKLISKRMARLVSQFKKFQMDPSLEPLTDKGSDEISYLVSRFNDMVKQIQDYIERLSTVTLQKHNAEYYALKMQINPHFLYNTLESLRMQAITLKQPVLANKLFILGGLFRWVLKSDNEMIPISEELSFVENYLELYNLGKSNCIEMEIQSSLSLSQYRIVKLVFQPIIENAIQHGKLDQIDDPLILIYIYSEAGILNIEIMNNGNKAEIEDLRTIQGTLVQSGNLTKTENLGLKNIHERIQSLFGDDYGLKIMESQPPFGFGILIRLPLNPLYHLEGYNHD